MEQWFCAQPPTASNIPILQVYAQKRPIANICRWEYPDNNAYEQKLQKQIALLPEVVNRLKVLAAMFEHEWAAGRVHPENGNVEFGNDEGVYLTSKALEEVQKLLKEFE